MGLSLLVRLRLVWRRSFAFLGDGFRQGSDGVMTRFYLAADDARHSHGLYGLTTAQGGFGNYILPIRRRPWRSASQHVFDEFLSRALMWPSWWKAGRISGGRLSAQRAAAMEGRADWWIINQLFTVSLLGAELHRDAWSFAQVDVMRLRCGLDWFVTASWFALSAFWLAAFSCYH
jgi:hypothetical protein